MMQVSDEIEKVLFLRISLLRTSPISSLFPSFLPHIKTNFVACCGSNLAPLFTDGAKPSGYGINEITISEVRVRERGREELPGVLPEAGGSRNHRSRDLRD